MNKKIFSLIAFALLAPLAGLAAQGNYDEVLRLQKKAGTANPLPAAGASRNEIALALADLATTPPAFQGGGGFSQDDYNALFALLQQYREEIEAMGLKMSNLEGNMKATRDKVEELNRRMEYLPPDGMKIHGRFRTMADDLLITGPGIYSITPNRFRHIKIHAEMDMTAVHGPFTGVSRIEVINFPGSYETQFGVTKAWAELRTPLAVQAGFIPLKLSPLTLWRHEDDDFFEPEPFKGRRQRLREYYLMENDNTHHMGGLRLATDLEFTEDKALELEAIGTVLATPNDVVFIGADPKDGKPSGTQEANFTTYLAGWRSEMELVKGFRLGYYGSKVWDEQETGSLKYTSVNNPGYSNLVGQPMSRFDSEVHSGRLQADLFGGVLKADAEMAMSRYMNPAVGPLFLSTTANAPNYFTNKEFLAGGWLPGSALNASVSLNAPWATLTARMRQVDEAFIAPAAQVRTVDPNRLPYGPFITENILYNPAAQDFGGFLFPDYPESTLNNRIVPPSSHLQGTGTPVFGHLLPYDRGYEAASPYGLATPNRLGYGGDLKFRFLDGGLQPSIKVDMSQEIEKQGGRPQEVYFMYWGGLVMDFQPWIRWPMKFTAGYRAEATDNADWVHFDSARLDLGLEYYPAKSTALFLGHRHLDYNGTIYNPNVAYSPIGMFGVHQLYESIGVGIRHLMDKGRFIIDAVYSNQLFPNRDGLLTAGKEVAYQMEQSFVQFSVKF